MRRLSVVAAILGIGFLSVSCCSTGYNTQKGAAIGGALGALAGQAIGRNTAGTLIGLAGGALLGAVVGNAEDQAQINGRDTAYQSYPQITATPRQDGYPHEDYRYQREGYREQTQGRWVDVPGQRVGHRWVPSHRVWVPAQP